MAIRETKTQLLSHDRTMTKLAMQLVCRAHADYSHLTGRRYSETFKVGFGHQLHANSGSGLNCLTVGWRRDLSTKGNSSCVTARFFWDSRRLRTVRVWRAALDTKRPGQETNFDASEAGRVVVAIAEALVTVGQVARRTTPYRGIAGKRRGPNDRKRRLAL